jgi:cytochrome c-type biogenesis protein CcmH/NrfG
MSKRDDARIARLAKKNAEKIVPPKRDRATQFDPTLRQRPDEEDEAETKRLFKEMKRREF